MGLDSLMAIELKNTIESTLGLSLPLASLLRGPTLEELAESLLTAQPTNVATQVSSLDDDADGPLSVGQRALDDSST